MQTVELKQPRWMTIIGWVLTLLPALFMGGMGLVMRLTNPDAMTKAMNDHGYPQVTHGWMFAVQMACVVIYLIPQTAVLGAILLTGYLGGAVATHVRANDGQFMFPVIFGVIVWLGIFLREPRLRAVALFRRG